MSRKRTKQVKKTNPETQEETVEEVIEQLPYGLAMPVIYHDEGGCRAAVITKVNDDDTVNLAVFPESGECGSGHGRTCVPFSEDETPGTFSLVK